MPSPEAPRRLPKQPTSPDMTQKTGIGLLPKNKPVTPEMLIQAKAPSPFPRATYLPEYT